MTDERAKQGPQLIDDGLLRRFAAECGAEEAMEFLVREEDGDACWSFEFPAPFFRIGRAPHCQLVLSDESVSRRHAYLQLLDGRLYCFDLHSRRGLRWPDGRRRRGVIDPPAGVRIDPFGLQPLSGESGRFDAPPDFESIHAVADDFVLHFLNAKGSSSRNPSRRIRQRITFLGRSPHCHVKLSHPDVKKFHCSLVRAGDSFWVVDLSGDAGLLVNGAPVPFAPLECGDELGVGPFRMRLWPAGSDSQLTLSGARSAPVTGDISGPEGNAFERTAPQLPEHRPTEVAAASGGSERILMALVEQFAQLQQSVLDQNYQQTLFLMELLNSSNPDPIAEQLRDLERVTMELQSLQARFQQTEPPDGAEDTEHVETAESEQPAQREPVNDSEHPGANQTASEPTDAESGSASGEERDSDAACEEPVGTADAAQGSPESGFVSAADRSSDPPINSHLWLADRISELERERRTGWDRIMQLLGSDAPRARKVGDFENPD